MRSDRWNDPRDLRVFAVPALAFFGGAVLGEILGLRRLLRGTMTVLALGGMTVAACGKMLSEPGPRVARPHDRAIRAARRRIAQTRSAPRRG